LFIYYFVLLFNKIPIVLTLINFVLSETVVRFCEEMKSRTR